MKKKTSKIPSNLKVEKVNSLDPQSEKNHSPLMLVWLSSQEQKWSCVRFVLGYFYLHCLDEDCPGVFLLSLLRWTLLLVGCIDAAGDKALKLVHASDTDTPYGGHVTPQWWLGTQI